ncbi:ROK family protein [Catenulispora subtropica]|uniref:ROK family protein n=1 Tax=Catenulispora subtropica TaxID=450798 RepID=A0ABN2SKE0_9ACTN
MLAVDVGGTKIAAALVAEDGRILRGSSVPTPGGRDADLVADAVVRAVADLDAAGGVAAVGIGSAGPLDVVAGTVSPVNIPAWRGYPIVATLRAAVPGVPVALAGDGQCMALGEYWRGEGEVRALLGMVVSTGVGGGVVLDGRVQTGPTGSAGHIGHITVDPDGPRCPCGGRGCVEVYASGPSMVRWAREQGWTPGSGADGAGLATDARAGDPVARAAFERGARAVAAAIVCAAALVELDEVVLGGGVVNGAADLLLDPIRAGMAAIAGLEFIRRVRVRASTLGAEAGLLGAAALGLEAATREHHAVVA